jgi:hypothetical protein
MDADKIENVGRLSSASIGGGSQSQKGEPGFRKTCLRTFEPANDRRDTTRRDRRSQKAERFLYRHIGVNRRSSAAKKVGFLGKYIRVYLRLNMRF